MKFFLLLAAIVLAQSLHCYNNAPAYPVLQTVSRSRPQNTKQGDLEIIISLTNRAYSEYGRNKEQSRRSFAEAIPKLETYIRKYENNPASLSYLQVLVWLGALHRNADNLDQARIVFEQCERHNAFNSSNATLKVVVDGRKVDESIASYVKAQLCFLTNCSKPAYKEAYDLVRIHGSSRGSDLAPQFSIPNRKQQHQKSRRLRT